MKKQLLLTLMCNDQPGLVEKIAATVHSHNGNWLESRLSRLSGKFVGIVQIETDDVNEKKLVKELKELENFGFLITLDTIDGSSNEDGVNLKDRSTNQPQNTNPKQKASEDPTSYAFSIVGNDRQGIIKEVSQAFSVRRINLENLTSQCTSTPHIGTPLFEASGKITVPFLTDIDELSKHLDRISDELAIDIQLEEL
ncbi:MAG: glycine cleavage system protein R [Cellvibrionaceae bacterium]